MQCRPDSIPEMNLLTEAEVNTKIPSEILEIGFGNHWIREIKKRLADFSWLGLGFTRLSLSKLLRLWYWTQSPGWQMRHSMT